MPCLFVLPRRICCPCLRAFSSWFYPPTAPSVRLGARLDAARHADVYVRRWVPLSSVAEPACLFDFVRGSQDNPRRSRSVDVLFGPPRGCASPPPQTPFHLVCFVCSPYFLFPHTPILRICFFVISLSLSLLSSSRPIIHSARPRGPDGAGKGSLGRGGRAVGSPEGQAGRGDRAHTREC